MPYRITGTLKLPSGVVAAGVDIKFKALKTFSPLIEQAEILIRTDAAGKYDVTLEFNTYLCEVTFSTNRPFNAGQFTVASDTVVGKDLPTLLNSSGWQPATPEWIIQIQTWLTEANASAAAADTSAKAAKVSETNSKASETSASSSASSALSSKNASKTSETNAATSASQASTSANRASTSETNAATSASAAAQSQTAAKASETAALEAADKAEQAAQTVVGALVDGGQYDPSSGQLPSPVTSGSKKISTIWKVTGTGVVGGIDLGTGDSLIYTSRDNSYYKIDNTESVSKVNNKTGVVVLGAADVNAAPSGFGLGEAQAYTVNDMNSDPEGWNGGAFGWFRATTSTLNLPDNRTGVGILQSYNPKSSKWVIYFAGSDIYTRFYTVSNGWGIWSKSYSTTNKPTAAEVGADPAGTASTAITTHEAKAGAHQISGVVGLQAALDAKPSRNVLINGEVTRVNQRGFSGDWSSLPVGGYGYDRWKKSGPSTMAQIIEAGNFVPGYKYVLSGVGITTTILTAPSTGNWTIEVNQSARNIQLELGLVATPFEVRSIQSELALCQRYYQYGDGWIQAYGAAGGLAQAYIPFKVSMRVSPTVNANYAPGNAANVNGSIATVASPNGFMAADTLITAGVGYAWIKFTASSEL